MNELQTQAKKEANEIFHLSEVNEQYYNENINFSVSLDNNKISFLQLLKYSRFVQREYHKNEIIGKLTGRFQHFQSTYNIKNENITAFFKLLKDEKIEVSSDQYCDLCKLSKIFEIDSLQYLLDKYLEKHSQNIDLIIKLMIDQNTSENFELFTNNVFSEHMEEYLYNNIDKCIANENFGKLPVSIMHRIFEKSDMHQISSDILYDFISKCFNEKFILFVFLNIRNLSDEKKKINFKFK